MQNRLLRVVPPPPIEEPDEMLTFGDLFEDLAYQLASGEYAGMALRLECLAREHRSVPLPGQK